MEEQVEIFCCYAREDQPLLLELRKHLVALQRILPITIWHDQNISPGKVWEDEILKHLNMAHVILLLISSDFMASDYCYSKELQRAMERHKRGEACVIPIILRPVYWQETPFAKLQALPTGGKPILDPTWHTRDEAFFQVIEGIRESIRELQKGARFHQPTMPFDKPSAAISSRPRFLSRFFPQAQPSYTQAQKVPPNHSKQRDNKESSQSSRRQNEFYELLRKKIALGPTRGRGAVLVRTADERVGQAVHLLSEKDWVGLSASMPHIRETSGYTDHRLIKRYEVNGHTIAAAIFELHSGDYMIWMDINRPVSVSITDVMLIVEIP